MAIFRKIHVQFWSDVFIQSLTPEQKFFFLYILTNERTRQCGIYEITKRQISFDTGYNVETIEKLIDFFENSGKVQFSRETNEIAIKNWDKYNGSRSPDVKNLVNKELTLVKNKNLTEWLQNDDTMPPLPKKSLRGEPEQEPEGEQEPESGAAVLENEILDILNKIKTGTQIEGNPENKFVVMVVLKMVEIFKNKFPHYPVTPDFDYAGCLRIAYKIAEYKGWKKSEVINGRMDDCLNSWRVIVDFIHNDTWLATRSIPDISTDKEWARLVQKMKQPKKKPETTEKTAPSLTHLKPI